MSAWRDGLRSRILRRLPVQKTVLLEHRRIYLLPTRMGWMLLLVAAAVWLGALNYSVSLAYALSFWIVALLLLSVGMVFRQLQGVRISLLDEHDAIVGEEVGFRLQFSWEGAGVRRLVLQHGEKNHSIPSEGGELDLTQASTKRGIGTLPVLRLYSEAPLGLIRAFAYLKLQAQAYVYPAPFEDHHSALVDTQQSGRLSLPGQDTVSHLGKWQPEMGVRRIAWKHFAKRQVLLAYQLQGELGGVNPAVVDWHAYPAEMPLEQRLQRMCWQLLAAMHTGRDVVLRLPERELTLTKQDIRRGLRLLAVFGGPHA